MTQSYPLLVTEHIQWVLLNNCLRIEKRVMSFIFIIISIIFGHPMLLSEHNQGVAT